MVDKKEDLKAVMKALSKVASMDQKMVDSLAA